MLIEVMIEVLVRSKTEFEISQFELVNVSEFFMLGTVRVSLKKIVSEVSKVTVSDS